MHGRNGKGDFRESHGCSTAKSDGSSGTFSAPALRNGSRKVRKFLLLSFSTRWSSSADPLDCVAWPSFVAYTQRYSRVMMYVEKSFLPFNVIHFAGYYLWDGCPRFKFLHCPEVVISSRLPLLKQVATGLPRISFLSGLTGEEIMMLIQIFPESGDLPDFP